jgi:hypothetical protein
LHTTRLKSELVWWTIFYTGQQAETAIAQYIDGFYNPIRRHSVLKFVKSRPTVTPWGCGRKVGLPGGSACIRPHPPWVKSQRQSTAENAIRVIALGRRNWLFAGSKEGGHCAATMITILQTAKLNGLNPQVGGCPQASPRHSRQKA